MTEERIDYGAADRDAMDPACKVPAAASEEETAEPMDPVGVLKLRRPALFEGKTYEEIPYDFCRITRADIRKWALAKQRRDGMVLNIAVDINGQETAFCIAADIPREMLSALDVRDYNEALGTTTGFFGS